MPGKPYPLQLALLAFLMMLTLAGCKSQQQAELILLNGTVHTLDSEKGIAEALAIAGQRIIRVGSAEDVGRFRGPYTQVLDLEGKTVLPGLVDAHAHMTGLGRSLSELDLVGTSSPAEIREMVIRKLATVPEGEWITGRGWDQNDWARKEFPTWRDLAGSESHPVFLRRVDGHAAWLNRTALDICRIDRTTEDPSGGKIIRDASGDPTGILIDQAMQLATVHLPEPAADQYTRWLKAAMKECNRVGLTGVHDAGVDSLTLACYRELERNREMTLRVNAMLNGDDGELLDHWYQRGPENRPGKMIAVQSVKLFADGALGSRGAALLEPYSDDPGNSGLLTADPDRLLHVTKDALANHFQVCIHAIGDRANRLVLDIYEEALAEYPREDHRLRIEHAQVLHPDDIPRFAALGVIPSMQPTHATSDMPWAEERLGAERARYAYAWRSLAESGCVIPFGSDFPVESPDPMLGIYAAVTRCDTSGNPEGGWFPEEKLTLEEALRGFTIHAAYAEFNEDHKGTIEAGKLADLTVVDRDPFTAQPGEIPRIEVVYTIVGGEIVYSVSESE